MPNKPGGYFEEEGLQQPTMRGMAPGGMREDGTPLYISARYNDRRVRSDSIAQPQSAAEVAAYYRGLRPDDPQLGDMLTFWVNQARIDMGMPPLNDLPPGVSTPIRRPDLDYK